MEGEEEEKEGKGRERKERESRRGGGRGGGGERERKREREDTMERHLEGPGGTPGWGFKGLEDLDIWVIILPVVSLVLSG